MSKMIAFALRAAVLLGVAGTGAADLAAAQETGKDIPAASAQQRESGTPETIACAQERGEALGRCIYRITRDGKGKTTIAVIFPNGFKRKLFFEDGGFLKASVTMSGVGTDADWTLKDGTHMIRVDGQRYEVPDRLISG